MPAVDVLVKNAEQNVEEWRKFEEDDNFKKIYTSKKDIFRFENRIDGKRNRESAATDSVFSAMMH